MNCSPYVVALTACLLALGTLCRGQSTLIVIDGAGDHDQLGYAVAGAGDVDMDGVDDVIVGEPFSDSNGYNSGSARVISGATGSVLHTFHGDSSRDNFGLSVSGAGDVNADGYADLIVGAPWDHGAFDGTGSAYVYSGATGSLLYAWQGAGLRENFGQSVSDAGDVNADGFDDVIVGAYNDGTGGGGAGRAIVFSGRDGAGLFTVYGTAIGDRMGTSVSDFGDVDGDGFDDVLVGAPQPFVDPGYVVVVSGRTGQSLRTLSGLTYNDHFGYSVSGLGDVDGDSRPDLVIGAFGSGSGTASLFSGATGAVIHVLDSGGALDFGLSVSGAGDVNGDGIDDAIVGARLADTPNGLQTGSAHAFSGATGQPLFVVTGMAQGDHLGRAVAAAGDVNSDGLADVIIGVPLSDANGVDAGRAIVVTGANLGSPIGVNYCGPGVVNASGHSGSIAASGSDLVIDDDLRLIASNLTLHAFGFFLTSQTQDFVTQPVNSVGNLCLGGSIGRYDGPGQVLNSRGSGSFELQLALASTPTPSGFTPVVPGETWNFQCWHRDVSTANATSNFTDAVSVTFR